MFKTHFNPVASHINRNNQKTPLKQQTPVFTGGSGESIKTTSTEMAKKGAYFFKPVLQHIRNNKLPYGLATAFSAFLLTIAQIDKGVVAQETIEAKKLSCDK